MNAEQYLNEALSGNMNLSALKPYISAGLLACHEIMEGYARHKLAEAHPQADNSQSDAIALSAIGPVLLSHSRLGQSEVDVVMRILSNMAQRHT